MGWSATAKYIPTRYTRNSRPIRSRVMRSEVNPHLSLAIHVLDTPLPYAPFRLSESKEKPLSDLHQESATVKRTVDSQMADRFMISRSMGGAMNRLAGRLFHGQYREFSQEELAWITAMQGRLLGRSYPALSTMDSDFTLAVSSLSL